MAVRSVQQQRLPQLGFESAQGELRLRRLAGREGKHRMILVEPPCVAGGLVNHGEWIAAAGY